MPPTSKVAGATSTLLTFTSLFRTKSPRAIASPRAASITGTRVYHRRRHRSYCLKPPNIELFLD